MFALMSVVTAIVPVWECLQAKHIARHDCKHLTLIELWLKHPANLLVQSLLCVLLTKYLQDKFCHIECASFTSSCTSMEIA